MRVAAGAAALLAAGFALTFLVGPWDDESITDLPLYSAYAQIFLDGHLPYRDVAFEYPPLAWPVLTAAGLAGDQEAYRVAFAGLAGALAVAMVALCGRLASVTGGDRTAALLGAAAAPLLCGAMLRTHFDLVPVVLTLAALALLCAARPRAGMAVLGVAVAVKLYPLVVAPVALAWLVARGQRRAALEGAAALAMVVVAVYAAAAVLSAEGVADSFTYHLDRPVQVESSPAVVLRALDTVGLGTATPNDGFRSDGLDHPAERRGHGRVRRAAGGRRRVAGHGRRAGARRTRAGAGVAGRDGGVRVPGQGALAPVPGLGGAADGAGAGLADAGAGGVVRPGRGADADRVPGPLPRCGGP